MLLEAAISAKANRKKEQEILFNIPTDLFLIIKRIVNIIFIKICMPF